jgi:hypothetical protein
LYVSLGRNVGEVPMSDEDWSDFQNAILLAVYEDSFVDPDTKAYGVSRYGAMREETAVFVWFDILDGLGNQALEDFRAIANAYEQECIAWSVSVTEFVEGVK